MMLNIILFYCILYGSIIYGSVRVCSVVFCSRHTEYTYTHLKTYIYINRCGTAPLGLITLYVL